MEKNKTELKANTKNAGNHFNPLVSIIVITYNSAKFVLETLESAKAQTYQNIELIISDDCSTDNSVEICREWLEMNKEVFARVGILSTDKNTGTPANCNRGVKASQGEWIKIIAGDDLLNENCVKDNLDFIIKNPTARIVFSNLITIDTIGKKIGEIYQNSRILSKENSIQFKKLLKFFFLSTPGAFISGETLKSCGGFDESYRLMEDYPFFLKLSKEGFKFFYLDSFTAKYRIHAESVINNVDRESSSVIFFREDTRKFYKTVIFKELLRNRFIYIYMLRILEFYLRKLSLKIKYPKLLKLPMGVVFKLLTR